MNQEIFLFLHSLANQSEGLNFVILFFAEYLPWLVIIAGGIFLWVHTDTSLQNKWKEIGITFLTAVTAYFSAIILKILFAVERPGVAVENIAPLFLKEDFAFPSGHATFFFAIATAIFLRHKKTGLWFFAAALLISLARIAAGVHFPIDILGGAVLGVGIAYFLKTCKIKEYL